MFRDRSGEIKHTGSSIASGTGKVPLLSVMLPTYNRSDALKRTLESLEKQTLSHQLYEIVVVDDGSLDGTESILAEFADQTPSRITYAILQENGGPARARNVGLMLCRSEIILIIGDDIEPDRNLVEQHLQDHHKNSDQSHAVLGHVSFPSQMNPSGFMRWLEKGGRKYFFNYQDLTAGQHVGPLFFYTCNVSVKMEMLERTGLFDESFPYASHEDLELGYRLAANGMRLIYKPEACGYHWHMLSVQGIARRVYLMGYSAVLFWQKVDDKGGFIKQNLRSLIAWFSSTWPSVKLWQWLQRKSYDEDKQYPFQWHIMLFLSFFIGLSDSKNKKSIRV